MVQNRYPAVVAFDLDGTILQGTSVSLELARHVGREADMTALHRGYESGALSNAAATASCASWFAGLGLSEVREVLQRGPWIANLGAALTRLKSAGSVPLLATISWHFAAEIVAEMFGFAATSGAELAIQDGRLTGTVTRFYDEHDKSRFVEDWCAAHGHDMREVAAVGDSRSDLQLFAQAGISVALNATAEARAAADLCVDTDDALEVLSTLCSPTLGLSTRGER